MNHRIALLSLSLSLLPTLGLSAEADRACNMLGREIALRAAEELDAGIDADRRGRLAQIAEEVCLEYTAETAYQATASGSAQAQQENEENEGDADEEEGFFNLKLIDPEDRVRRPGLKRR